MGTRDINYAIVKGAFLPKWLLMSVYFCVSIYRKLILSFLKHINPLITGIFFLVWSMNAYFLFGNIGRHAAIFIGFILILLSALIAPNKKGSAGFFLATLLVYLIYLALPILQNHQTLSSINLIFGLVCFTLLNAGYILGKNFKMYKVLPDLMIYIYSILTIAGSFYFIRYQSYSLILGRSFGFEDESVGAIGIAYTHSILILYFLALVFIKKHNISVKILIIFSIFALIGVILTTQSRGAIIFLSSIFLILAYKGIQVRKKTIKVLFNFIFIIAALIISINLIQNQYPIIADQINQTVNRFQRLTLSGTGAINDRSALARAEMYNAFFNDIGSYIIVGKQDYRPYPHNQFLEIVLRWGIIFGLPLILLSVHTLYKALKYIAPSHYSSNTVVIMIISTFLFSYFQSMTSLSLEMNRMLWLGFGFVYSYQVGHELHE